MAASKKKRLRAPAVAKASRTERPAKGRPAARGADRILMAARKLFVREGGTHFTARGVASEAGVSLGAVQHFFRTREDLLRATLEHVLADFRREYDRLQEELPFNAEARLFGVLDILLADIWRQDSRRFFFGLYAFSGSSRFVQQLMNETYAHHQRQLARFISAARPGLTETRCMDLALQIGALIDGLMIYTGPGFPQSQSRKQLSASVKDSIRHLIGVA